MFSATIHQSIGTFGLHGVMNRFQDCLLSDPAFLIFRTGASVSANAKGAPSKDGNSRSGGANDKLSAPANDGAEAACVLFFYPHCSSELILSF